MLALKLGKERGELNSDQMNAHLKAMIAIPDQLRTVLQQKEKARQQRERATRGTRERGK
jgi:glucosamine 6-phosphate synthetase-like amidotransferase/phosphosugar isomerase protein